MIPFPKLPRRFRITAALLFSDIWSSLSIQQTVCAPSYQFFLGVDCDASELVQFFDSHSKPVIAKSVQYLPVYRRHLDRFRLDKDLGDLYAESGQTLQGSFSAVSKPNFASKYALESSRRDLHNALLCTVLESIIENWGKKDLAKTTPKKGENKKTRGH